ncbi:hypothetical protein BBP40_011936 [Aspergillus hancockii]|nr:hypothetical protein BBP40_011936 [Aspergillus hancockii]
MTPSNIQNKLADVQIRYATEADAPALARVSSTAMGQLPFYCHAFPGASEESMQRFETISFLKFIANPEVHVLCGVDAQNGEIIAVSRWTVPSSLGYEQPAAVKQMSEEALEKVAKHMDYAPRPMNEAVFEGFRRMFAESRKKRCRADDILLDLLCILPGHQGKGLGSIMLEWGIKKADAQDKRVYLESTPDGMGLYKKYDFELVEEVMFEYGQFGVEGKEKVTIMLREPAGCRSRTDAKPVNNSV